MRFATPAAYYDHRPSLDNATGDIWKGLPSFGLFKTSTVSGIVITPACDLANGKSETITYLPVVPISQWHHSQTFLSQVQRQTADLIARLEISPRDTSGLRERSPSATSLDNIKDAVEHRVPPTSKTKDLEMKARILAGIEIIGAISRQDALQFDERKAALLFGSKVWESDIGRIVTNAQRQDIHFLPQSYCQILCSENPGFRRRA